MSGRTIRVLAAAVPAAVALAGCGGGPVRTGAAAVVGDDRITISALAQAVQDGKREFTTDPRANQLRSRAGGEPGIQSVLFQLVQIRVLDEAARRAGLRVSNGQVDLEVRALDDNVRFGPSSADTRALGLPVRYARDLARERIVATEILRRYGGPESRALLVRTARGLNIKINPRYGTFDANRLEFGPTRTMLSRPESGIG